MHILTEEDVGITEYCSKLKGFKAVIKAKICDFLVNEITPDGKVVHLSDLNVPNPPGNHGNEQKTNTVKILSPNNLEKFYPSGLTKEIDDQLQNLEKSSSQDDKYVTIPIDSLKKEDRKHVHAFIRENYKKLQSMTCDISGSKCIKVIVGTAVSLQRENKRLTPKPEKYYTCFHLYKENMDTMVAIDFLAHKLRTKASNFHYAGTKDKRGKTVQRVCIANIPPRKIVEVSKMNKNIIVGNFSFLKDNFSLGDLKGNSFKIVLREVTESDEVINEALESVKNTGALNYYGLQRFGSRPGHTHETGKHILASNWDEAIKCILRTSEGESSVNYQILHKFNVGEISAAEAVKEMKDARCFKGINADILSVLADLPNDKVGALMRLPRNTRKLYLHAYQAYLWNRVLSKRVQKYGMNVLPGDIVAVDASALATDEADLNEEDIEENVEESKNSEENSSRSNRYSHSKVRVITEEEVNSIKFSEVLLPSVGYAVKFPENEIKDWYIEMLAEDGLTLENLNLKQKCLAISGAYRNILIEVSDVRHRICEYSDVYVPLVPSDRDLLFNNDINISKNEEDIKEKQKAVVVELSLPSSCYATMVLREILKIGTQPLHHNIKKTAKREQEEMDDHSEEKRIRLDIS